MKPWYVRWFCGHKHLKVVTTPLTPHCNRKECGSCEGRIKTRKIWPRYECLDCGDPDVETGGW